MIALLTTFLFLQSLYACSITSAKARAKTVFSHLNRPVLNKRLICINIKAPWSRTCARCCMVLGGVKRLEMFRGVNHKCWSYLGLPGQNDTIFAHTYRYLHTICIHAFIDTPPQGLFSHNVKNQHRHKNRMETKIKLKVYTCNWN